MLISIIIRCLNEEQHIGKLLSGILAQTHKDVEIIIVDSGSSDATLDIARQFPTKIISIKPKDFSFGYALNKGCEQATGDILLFASAHIFPVYTTWLEEILIPFENHKTALVYGRQIGHDTITKYSEHRLFAKWFPVYSEFNQSHPFCNNANCAIRKELWLQQDYDESLTGLEDLDWATKIMKKGWRIAYNAQAIIVHVHEETPKRVLNRYRREAIALKRIMPNEKFTIFNFVRLTLGNIFSDYYHANKEKVFLKNIWDIPIFRIMQFWGTYKGYQQVGSISSRLRNRFYYPNQLKIEVTKTITEKHRIKYSNITNTR